MEPNSRESHVTGYRHPVLRRPPSFLSPRDHASLWTGQSTLDASSTKPVTQVDQSDLALRLGWQLMGRPESPLNQSGVRPLGGELFPGSRIPCSWIQPCLKHTAWRLLFKFPVCRSHLGSASMI